MDADPPFMGKSRGEEPGEEPENPLELGNAKEKGLEIYP